MLRRIAPNLCSFPEDSFQPALAQEGEESQLLAEAAAEREAQARQALRFTEKGLGGLELWVFISLGREKTSLPELRF